MTIEEAAASASQGKVSGVIIPPPDIRAVVDKTAQFVARNGKSFEQRIQASDDGKTAKFNFLKPYDPYNAYYEAKIREFEESPEAAAAAIAAAAAAKAKQAEAAGVGEAEKLKARQAAAAAAAEGSVSMGVIKAAILNPLSRFSIASKLASSFSEVEPPSVFEFSLGAPTTLSCVDADVIKLTAQYTAVNGREFLGGIAQREQRNPQFDFLKPTHMLFGYFTQLVDAYAKVLQPSNKLRNLAKEKMDRFACLEKAVQRWEYTSFEEERKKREKSAEDEDRVAYLNIDWYDFTVVETIAFPADEFFPHEALKDEQNGAGTENGYVDSGKNAMEEEQSSEPAPVEEMEVAVEEEDDELNVVSGTDYVPRTAAMAAGQRAPQLMYDPTSGRNIPVDQISEHMRIQLMDPKWMEQQKRFHDKQQDTSFATGSSIADSLKGFAKARGDIFGSSSDGNSLLTPEEAERKKRVLEEGRKESDLGGLPVRSESDDLQSVQESNARAAAAVSKPQPPVPAPPPAPTPTSTQAPPAPPPAPLPRASSQPMPPPPPQFQHTHTMPLQHMGMQPPQMGMQQVSMQIGGMGMPPPPPPPMMMPGQQMAMGAGMPMGMDMGMGMPPMPPPPADTLASTGTKRPREEEVLMSAEDFAALIPSGIANVDVVVCSDASNPSFNLNGQTVSLQAEVHSTIKQLKELLSPQLGGMPANKMQLKGKSGFLKDAQSLAAANIGLGVSLELSMKTRGGKK